MYVDALRCERDRERARSARGMGADDTQVFVWTKPGNVNTSEMDGARRTCW